MKKPLLRAALFFVEGGKTRKVPWALANPSETINRCRQIKLKKSKPDQKVNAPLCKPPHLIAHCALWRNTIGPTGGAHLFGDYP